MFSHDICYITFTRYHDAALQSCHLFLTSAIDVKKESHGCSFRWTPRTIPTMSPSTGSKTISNTSTGSCHGATRLVPWECCKSCLNLPNHEHFFPARLTIDIKARLRHIILQALQTMSLGSKKKFVFNPFVLGDRLLSSPSGNMSQRIMLIEVLAMWEHCGTVSDLQDPSLHCLETEVQNSFCAKKYHHPFLCSVCLHRAISKLSNPEECTSSSKQIGLNDHTISRFSSSFSK